VISPEKAGKLLEEVVLERIMSFVDLKGLCLFQQELEVALIEVGVEYDEVAQVAKQMVDDAIHRLADDPRFEVLGPGSRDQLSDCALCEQPLRDRADVRGS
jgi:hypothetical protein